MFCLDIVNQKKKKNPPSMFYSDQFIVISLLQDYSTTKTTATKYNEHHNHLSNVWVGKCDQCVTVLERIQLSEPDGQSYSEVDLA